MFDKLNIKEKLEDEFYVEKYGKENWKKRIEYYNSLQDSYKTLALDALTKKNQLERIVEEKLGLDDLEDELELFIGLASDRGGAYITIDSNDVREYCGIMKHAYKEVKIQNFGSWFCDWNNSGYYTSEEFDVKKEARPLICIELDFSYRHIDLGSNGVKFMTVVFENGQWSEHRKDKE